MKDRKKNLSLNDFIYDYNRLLSKAFLENKSKFKAFASPTLNKEETVTFLYRSISVYIQAPNKKINKENSVVVILKFIARLSYTFYKIIITSLRFRIKSIPEDCVYIRTWLIPRSIKNGIVCDDYFRSLIDELSVEYNVFVGFQPLGYGKILSQYSKANKTHNYIIPIGLLSILDIIKIFITYLATAKIRLNQTYNFKGVDVSELINYSLKNDYYKLRSFQAYVELFIAKKIKKCNPKIFLYMFENQSWENSYLSVFKDKKIKTIGYQSSGFSFRFLNFFPSELDGKHFHYPEKLLTVGDIYTGLLKKYGHFPMPIYTFAALRFNYPTKNGKYIIEKPVLDIHKRLLYAFPSHFYQYKSVIKDLIDIFGNTQIEVHLKLHPLFFDGRKFKVRLPKNFYIIDRIQMESLKHKYDITLFNDNSFGIESLIMGVKSFEYEFGEIYPENRLIDFELYNQCVDKKGLIKMRDNILNNSISKNLNQDYISKYINNMYKIYDHTSISLFK